jgi:hypothetical protein
VASPHGVPQLLHKACVQVGGRVPQRPSVTAMRPSFASAAKNAAASFSSTVAP